MLTIKHFEVCSKFMKVADHLLLGLFNEADASAQFPPERKLINRPRQTHTTSKEVKVWILFGAKQQRARSLPP